MNLELTLDTEFIARGQHFKVLRHEIKRPFKDWNISAFILLWVDEDIQFTRTFEEMKELYDNGEIEILNEDEISKQTA